MTVRAKVQLVEIAYTTHGGQRVKFEPRYDDNIPEDRRFMTSTPWGSFEIHINNPAAMAQFELGKNYYVDFVPLQPAA